MAEREELEALRALQSARTAGDQRAELQALQALQAARSDVTAATAPSAIPAAMVSPGLRGLLAPSDTSFGEAFVRGAGNQVANSALTMMQRGVNDLASIPRRALTAVASAPPPLLQGLAPLLQQLRVPQPSIDLPRAEELSGLLRTVEDRPVATALGQTAGDVGMLMALRAPARAGLAKLNPQQAIARFPAVANVLQSFQRAAATPGTARALDSFLRSPLARSTAKAAGRAAEAGAEGAALAILSEGDPVQLAALGAGGQLAGSVALGLTRGKRLVATALLAGGGVQLLKELTPGGKDFVLESLESGFEGVAHAVLLGATARLIGAGRVKSENFPLLNEIPTIARGAVLSIVNDVASESERGVSSTERALQHLLADAEQFTGAQIARLERGLDRGKFGETVSQLIDSDADFRRVIDSPLPDVAEVAQRRLRNAIEADNGPSAAEIVVDLRATADTIKRRLPADLRERLDGLNPQAAIARALEQGEDVLARLTARQRTDALEINLSELIGRSTIRDPGNRRIVDAQRLAQQWQRLPQSVREAYSPAQRAAIEGFIDEAAVAPLAVLPPLLARSLMLPEGALSRRLRGAPTTPTEATEF